MKKPIIYDDIKYLIDGILSDEDLINLTKNKSLLLSIIVCMFRYIKSDLSTNEILKICKQDEWFNKYSWTSRQRNKFERNVAMIYKNVYQYTKERSKNEAMSFMTLYGFKVKNNH